MTIIMVDIESDGPIPGDYSMISFGAVVVDSTLDKTFYAELMPISDKWLPNALSVSGFTRKQTQQFAKPKEVMANFAAWIKEISSSSPQFMSDNNGFDWQFINWYFIHFNNKNPFGFSSSNLGSLYKGMVMDVSKNFKHLRKTAHTHNALDDAIGNAEALLYMVDEMGLKLRT